MLLNIAIICGKNVFGAEKYKYLLTQQEFSDILTERLLGELRPDKQKCDEAGDCGDNFSLKNAGNFRGVCPQPINSATIGRLRWLLYHAYIVCTELEPEKIRFVFRAKSDTHGQVYGKTSRRT